jgi:hypothetical protein
MQGWLQPGKEIFRTDPNYRINSQEKKHRLMMRLEQWFGLHFNKNHYRQVK